ncbi:hypothetical protein [Cedecea davisae]|uniref:hypothetical protein n=1 Tax=Cedecea davisae TaxID=158484 RepID=UPI00242F242A|nr:hypothetical protein [Cedecea davisae]
MVKITDPNDAFACITAFNTMMAQAIGIVLGLTALPESVANTIGEKMAEEVGLRAMNSLGEVIYQLNSADSLIDRATAFATLVIQSAKIVTVPKFVQIVLNEMSLGDKIL